MSSPEPIDPRSNPATPPLFWGYKGRREVEVSGATNTGFGEEAGALRAVFAVPGMSWKSAVAGSTVVRQKAFAPLPAQRIAIPAQRYSARLVDVREADLDAAGVPDVPSLPLRLRLLEGLSDEAFVDLFNLPEVVLEAAKSTWKQMQQTLPHYREWARYQVAEFWQDVQTYLGTVETMRERLMSGGLLAKEWQMLRIWVLGALDRPAPLGSSRVLQALRQAWQWIVDHVPFLKRDERESPIPPEAPPGLHSESHFHLFGLEATTHLGTELVAWSNHGREHLPAFLLNPGSIPPDVDPALVLDSHAAYWRREHQRRQKIYYWSGKIAGFVIELILKYLALGPVGLVIVLLNLLAEGVLQVIKKGKEIDWPALPAGLEMEVV